MTGAYDCIIWPVKTCRREEAGFTLWYFDKAVDESLAKYEGSADEIVACRRAVTAELARCDRSEAACVRAECAVVLHACKAAGDVRRACNTARIFADWVQFVTAAHRAPPSPSTASRWARVAEMCLLATPSLVDAMASLPPATREATARGWSKSGFASLVDRAVARADVCGACAGTGLGDFAERATEFLRAPSAARASSAYRLAAHVVSGADGVTSEGMAPAARDVRAAIERYARRGADAGDAARVSDAAAAIAGPGRAGRGVPAAAFCVELVSYVAALPRVGELELGEWGSWSSDEESGRAAFPPLSADEARMVRLAVDSADGAVVAAAAEEVGECWAAFEEAAGVDYGDCVHYHLLSVDFDWRVACK